MTQEETTHYNKMCAEFLGGMYSMNAEAWGFGDAKNIGSKMFHGIMYHDIISAERFEKELKFDSDWNWIMEVVEAIEKLYDSNIYFKVAWNNVTVGIATQYELAYETGFDGVEIHREGNKKESVVKAINLFLIWYNKNNK